MLITLTLRRAAGAPRGPEGLSVPWPLFGFILGPGFTLHVQPQGGRPSGGRVGRRRRGCMQPTAGAWALLRGPNVTSRARSFHRAPVIPRKDRRELVPEFSEKMANWLPRVLSQEPHCQTPPLLWGARTTPPPPPPAQANFPLAKRHPLSPIMEQVVSTLHTTM